MSELSPQLAAALRGERPLLFGAVEINLPNNYDLLLLDGAGELMIPNSPTTARKFVGRDPVYGVLDTIKGLADALGGTAPSVSLGLIPSATASLAKLVDPAVQGSPVTISMGCIDMWTGLVVPTPYVLFVGELDVPTVNWDSNDRRLEFTVTSIAERLFATEEGLRLSDAFHQHVWPGELGLAFVTAVETYVPWGQKLDTSAIETRTNNPSLGAITGNRT
ncbi:hypothetical protein EWE75_12050 [Sphingomonas populi]|uniref:GP-PDE domain-containing protein n=1 Tax=Sphingomonas populi TaxID=2484750 RepID=A0A4Q6XWE7_9SPHN|nr:hypothetical protein [Sphingomonas populi]RZF64271.1 hypothetical protein EWE75_12050 [Sphingomonas populi]